jgi:hypothetical protein
VPTNAGIIRSQGDTRAREHGAERHQAAGGDLAHQRQRRLAVDHDWQARALPRLQPAGPLTGLAAACAVRLPLLQWTTGALPGSSARLPASMRGRGMSRAPAIRSRVSA